MTSKMKKGREEENNGKREVTLSVCHPARKPAAPDLEQLDPALLLRLDALLHLGARAHPHALQGGDVLLPHLRLRLRVGQLDDAQAGVPEAARQRHQLFQGERHQGGRPLTSDWKTAPPISVFTGLFHACTRVPKRMGVSLSSTRGKGQGLATEGPCKSLTFYGITEELVIVDGNQRVTKQGAEQVEEGDDAAGVFEGHGRAPGDHLEQRHCGPEHRVGGQETGR